MRIEIASGVLAVVLALAGSAVPAAAAEEGVDQQAVLMSATWAEQACDAWNASADLTDKLVESKWIDNDEGRGFKVLQVYRRDCAESPWVELRITKQDGKATCVYGGAVETEPLEPGADYVMNALTERWLEMGNGDYGPMKGMLTGRLKFAGPNWEAMKNMGPFTSFLLLVGEVPSEAATCP